MEGLIFDVKRYALHDGPGIRTTVFFKGCPLRCAWCHNPEGQSSQPEVMFRAGRCIQCGACLEVCNHGAITPDTPLDRQLCQVCGECIKVCYSGARRWVGRWVNIEELLAEIERDRPFYDASGGGVTFSGGEPLAQSDFLLEILRQCRQRGIHTTLDTCGYAPWETFDHLRPYVDLFLYDLKLMDEARHRQYTGVSNEIILQNLAALARQGHRLVVRAPLIAGINDDQDNLGAMADFLAGLPCNHTQGHAQGYAAIERVDLAPYHEIGLAKYTSLGRISPLEGALPPSPARLQEAVEIFRRAGLHASAI
ncbi:MAG: glycyl-radical enzyme activating protein [Anaerolineales bacterium]|nr:glycyl-radical enzyme activating protein [Anaerolineales bacterium]